MFSSCLTRNILCLLSICSVIGQNVFRNVVFLEWYSWVFLNEACTVWENKVWSEDEIYEIKLRRKKPGKEPGSPPTATENQATTGDSGDPQQSVHTAPCQGHCSEFPQGWSLFFLLVDWGGGGGCREVRLRVRVVVGQFFIQKNSWSEVHWSCSALSVQFPLILSFWFRHPFNCEMIHIYGNGHFVLLFIILYPK